MYKKFTVFIIVLLMFASCKESSSQKDQVSQSKKNKVEVDVSGSTVYESDLLTVSKLSDQIYTHVSYLETNNYGKVSCNGMLIINGNEVVIFDSPTGEKSSIELINFIRQDLKAEIKALIPTHFHADCVGGLKTFEDRNIQVYMTTQTMELLQKKGTSFLNPIQTFNKDLTLNVGSKKVTARYFGEGHTPDNIIGYFPDEHTVFGGCLIKEMGAGEGNLKDANTHEWPHTVRKIKIEYPSTKRLIPGHGTWGGPELFDYTINLFQKSE